MKARLALIGGSGLYSMEDIRPLEELEVPTPWGLPSDKVTIADVHGEPVAFLPRHGRGHRYLPAEVPSRANIWALKSLGVQQIISVSAVGSLTESFAPGDFVLCDELVDKTSRTPGSFFGQGVVGHVGFADPFCPGMRAAIAGRVPWPWPSPPQRGHLRLHGGAVVLHEGRIEPRTSPGGRSSSG